MRFGMGRKRHHHDAETEETRAVEGDGAAEQGDDPSPDVTSGNGAAAPAAAEGGAWKSASRCSLAKRNTVRRRAGLDTEGARKFANERLLTELLPVLDNF